MSAVTYEFLGLPVVVSSPEMEGVLERVRRCAQTDASVLIEGESGSGKEIVARALHHYSLRSHKPWIDISCAALPENLIESELFGYERGAFSGADARKQGLFELAEGGTLFLDEIAELDPRLQVKLLRFLDCGEFFRLGGVKKVKVDVRVLAATNQELQTLVKEGRFRKDLYHRLAQLRIDVPPLRERPDDVVALTAHFSEKYGLKAKFSVAAERLLTGYGWPGNVRELRNVVIACAAEAPDGEIQPRDLPAEISAERTRSPISIDTSGHYRSHGARPGDAGCGGVLEAAERDLIMQVLEQTNGHQERAARILGISSRTLGRKLRTYKLGSQEAAVEA
jgi:two-component system response regulator AtoC